MQHIEHVPLSEQSPQKFDEVASSITLEAKIMNRSLGENPSPENVSKWVDAYAAKFRSILDADPTLLVEWKDNPRAAIETIEAQLYGQKK